MEPLLLAHVCRPPDPSPTQLVHICLCLALPRVLQLVMDAPWRQQARGHASKLVLWALVEAVIAGKAVVW